MIIRLEWDNDEFSRNYKLIKVREAKYLNKISIYLSICKRNSRLNAIQIDN